METANEFILALCLFSTHFNALSPFVCSPVTADRIFCSGSDPVVFLLSLQHGPVIWAGILYKRNEMERAKKGMSMCNTVTALPLNLAQPILWTTRKRASISSGIMLRQWVCVLYVCLLFLTILVIRWWQSTCKSSTERLCKLGIVNHFICRAHLYSLTPYSEMTQHLSHTKSSNAHGNIGSFCTAHAGTPWWVIYTFLLMLD